MLEGTIGTLASAHVFASLPNLDWGTELFGPLLLTDDIVKKPIEYRDNSLIMPESAGLGVELDLDQIEKYKIGRAWCKGRRTREERRIDQRNKQDERRNE